MNNYIITRASDTNELYHHGVKGMKWGHRKSLPTSSLRNQVDSAKTDYKKAKSERKQQIKNTYKSLNKSASLGEKLTYNNATRKKAAKYVVDNGMTVEQAKSRANKDAIRNTGAMLAAYGSIAAVSLYKMNH